MKIKSFLLVLAIVLSFPVSAQNRCNKNCLEDIARQYLSDVADQDYSRLPWGDAVRYTENNVAMMIGDGFWGAGPAVRDEGFMIADAFTGNVVWLGITTEHGQAAYHGLRLKIANRKITEVESYLGREGTPDLYADTAGYEVSDVFSQDLPRRQHTKSSRMIDIVNGYFDSREQDSGRLKAEFTEDCSLVLNGVDLTRGNYWAADIVQGCGQQLAEGLYKPVDRIRARRFPVVDEDTGVVVALSIEDHAVRYVDYQSKSGRDLKVDIEYPNSRGLLEIFRVVDGKIARIEGVSVFLPYYIHDLWAE